MKKAFIEQLLFGFILFMGIVTFVATISDENQAREKIYDLKALAKNSTKAIAKHYENKMDMCEALEINKNILKESILGQELLKKGLISFDWWDTNDDGQPDQIRTDISALEHATFWYKFLDKDSFSLGPFNDSTDIDIPNLVTIKYGDRPSASYRNAMGTYEVDNDGCVQNMQMHLANSKDWDKWEETDDSGERIPIVDQIKSPPKKIFFIANAFTHFSKSGDELDDEESISLEEPHCKGSNKYPEITMNNITKQGSLDDSNSGNVFFEDIELNADGTEHMHIIPNEILQDYLDFKEDYSSGTEKDKYEAFKQFADAKNADNDPDNDINYKSSPTNSYKYALEDLTAKHSDFDFTDLLLDSTRNPIPNTLNQYDINEDGSINLKDCDDGNEKPEVTLGNCPLTIDENTQTSAITWSANDPDGTITTKSANAVNGNAIINENGTVTYTPNDNFNGSDTVTVTVRDDDGGSGSADCAITVNDINQPPTITGTPMPSVTAGENYIFIPLANDDDGDPLSFSIQNIPAWANFDTNTGQLSGVPNHGQVGIYSSIVITVSDGKGGTDSLTFTIEVLEDEENQAPELVTPFANLTIIEGQSANIEIASHFNDPDGDELTFAIVGIISSETIFTASNVTSYTYSVPANGMANKVIAVTVSASDGELEASGYFTITIKDKNDVENFFHTFTTDDENWVANTADKVWSNANGGVLKITARTTRVDQEAYFTFDFKFENANKNVKVDFDAYFVGGWESSGSNQDYFKVKLRKTEVLNESPSNSGPTSYSVTGTTNTSGRIRVKMILNVSSTNEFLYIDNVRVTLQ